MSDDRKDLPPVKSANFLERVRESLSTYLGNRGNLLDRGITLRDLTESGIVTLRPGFLSTGRGSPIGGAGSSVAGVYEPDLTPPPTPTGFVATAAISNLLVECDAQTYRQGHGHAKSVLYGATWVPAIPPAINPPLPVFTDAVVLTEFGGTVAAHATNPATTWHLWLKWVTVDGVASTVPAGGTNGVVTRTGEDVALLLTALDGKLTDNQLHNDLGARIDLIDGGVPQAVLPYPLAKLAAMQDGLNNQVRMDVDAAASDLLTAVIATSNTRQLVTDAGIYTDPATGVVKIYAMEAANDHLNTVDIRLNAAEGNITLKASTAYVDSQIAAAVLSPADLILYDGLDARLASAEVDIDGLQGQIVLKAATFDLNATTARVTTAEAEIDSLQGEMALRVTNTEFDLAVDGLSSRVGTAEVTLSALGDTSAVTSFVQQQSTAAHRDAADATTMLRAILNDDAAARASRGALAFAREDLTAHTNAGIEAEAAQRLELAVAVANNLASFEGEKIVRAGAESALALASETLRARLDSGDYAAVKVQSSASASAVTGLYAQYTVKLDVNGKVSGFGLASTGPTGEGSAFEVRVDKFVIAAEAGATPGFVPFQVLTVDTDMGGFIAPAGAYASKAFILDAQITRAKIGLLAVDDARIDTMTAAKLTAGSVQVGTTISSTGTHSDGTPAWSIDGGGLATFNNAVVRGTVYATDGKFTGEIEALGAGGAGGDKARMYYGNFEVYRTVPGVGQVLYKALSRSESGVGANNVPVTIPGYFRTQPRVLVSPASLQLYAAAYAGQNQSITVQANSILESSPGSMVWSFTPVATLNLAANAGSAVINQSSGTQSGAWTSSQYVTPANTTSISPSVTLASNRGNGASQYFYRTVRWRVEYWNGSSWVTGAYTTVNLGADTAANTVSTAAFNFPGAGAWTFRIYCEAYDTNGAVFGAASYNYATDTASRTGNVSVSTQASATLDYTPAYSLPAGWEVTGVGYVYTYSYNIQAVGSNCSARVTGPGLSKTVSNGASEAQNNVAGSASATSNSLVFTAWGTASFGGGYWISALTLHNATATISRRQLAANSTTAQNSFQFNSYGYTLTSAQVLATGSLNWVAIGD